jgi:hypothetical protein
MIDRGIYAVRFLETKWLMTQQAENTFAVGVGDETFMIGRFLNHQGDADVLLPAARFGTISMPARRIWNGQLRRDQLSFGVEMRSRTGFSGSPVFVYRTAATNPFEVKGASEKFWGLLGVNWGYILEKDTGENTWLWGCARMAHPRAARSPRPEAAT